MIKGFLFDMDGTMIDNMMIHHRAWQRKLSELGLEMTLQEVKENIHGVNHEILARLFGDRFSPAERDRIAAEKEAAYREIYLPQLRLIDGLQAFLDEAHAMGIPMAIGTAAPEENAYFIIKELGLGHYFQGIFHSGSVSKGKPDPEIFELAAASLDLKASDCLIFEDSVTGAEAAERAGAAAIIVTTTHAEEEFTRFSNVRRFIKNYEGLSPQSVRTL
jgi:HAD superfamily hydrolase (TIGR01509 family)